MRKIVLAVSLASITACGGTTVPLVVSSGAAPTPTLTSPSTVTTGSPASGVNPVSAGPDASFATLLNNVRISNSAGTVTHNAQLDAAAQAHADDMLANNYFSHTGLNGSSPGDRATAAGYAWRTYGENIAAGYRSEDGVMKGWTNSPGHHANNINPNFKEFGLGYSENGSSTRWVLMLGAR